MKSIAIVLLLLASAALYASGQAETQLDGCVSAIPGGGLQLAAVRSGTRYVLKGDAGLLLRNLHRLVRVRGVVSGNAAQNSAEQVFTVRELEEIAATCTSPLPAQVPVAVVGKAGEGQVAIPITTSASAGQTTPGFQTESVMDQEPPQSGRSRARPGAEQASPYAPSNVAQAAQTSEAADRYAESATRTEIQPGNTLGAENYVASSGTENVTSPRYTSVQLRGDETQQFSPATITVKVGTVVKWTNLSNKTHEITSNPGKQLSTTVLPPGGKPFDSGFLRPGASFTFSFQVPGVYRYFCLIDCKGNPSGSVIVQR